MRLACTCSPKNCKEANTYRMRNLRPGASTSALAAPAGLLQRPATRCERASWLANGFISWLAGYVRGAPPMVASGSRSME